MKLVNVDWCGRDGEDRYPVDMNPALECQWHPEVKAGAFMRKRHDDHLFDKLPVMDETPSDTAFVHEEIKH